MSGGNVIKGELKSVKIAGPKGSLRIKKL